MGILAVGACLLPTSVLSQESDQAPKAGEKSPTPTETGKEKTLDAGKPDAAAAKEDADRNQKTGGENPPVPLPTQPNPPSDPLPIPELPYPQLTPPQPPSYRVGQDVGPTLFNQFAPVAQAEPVPAYAGDTNAGTFIVPGFYGAAPQRFTPGHGRFLGPRFRANASIGIGYDDNIDAGRTDASEKVGSGFTNLNLAGSYQTAGRMRLFIVDAHASTDLHWSHGSPDYDASLGVTYQHKFLAPAHLTANLSLSYRTQPDYSQINLVTTQRGTEEDSDEGYLAMSAKIDYSYRWTPQFSTRTSLAADSILYGGGSTDGAGSGGGGDGQGKFFTITAGNEFRYRVERYTWIAETRYEATRFLDDDDLNSTTLYLLAGAEWNLGRWIQASTRLGGTLREYDSGGDATSPYGEFAIVFNPTAQHSFGLTTRYGFELNNAVSADDRVGQSTDSKTFRVGLSYTRALTPRLSASLNGNYIQSESGETEFDGDEELVDGGITLSYRATDRTSLSLSFNSTKTLSGGTELGNRDRNRVLFTANFAF